MFQSTILAGNFCVVLEDEYRKHLALNGSSEQAANLMVFYMNTWQDMQPRPLFMTNENGRTFDVPQDVFSRVVADIQDPRIQIDSLPVFHKILFPYMSEQGFMLYYTQEQVSTLAWAMIGRVDRIITADNYVHLADPSFKASKTVVHPEPLVIPNAKELLTGVMTSLAVAQCDEITKVDARNTKRMVELASGIADALEARDALSSKTKRIHLDDMLDHVFNVETTHPDRDLAKALALSKAITEDEEAKFERDMERAMAESMRDI